MNRLQNHRVYWNCECDCGGHKIVRGDLLKDGTITDCGCVFKQKDKDYRENIVGRRFGKLTVTNEKTSEYRCGDIKYRKRFITRCLPKKTEPVTRS